MRETLYGWYPAARGLYTTTTSDAFADPATLRICTSRGSNTSLSPTIVQLPLRERPPRVTSAYQSGRKWNQQVTGQRSRASSAVGVRPHPPQLEVRCTSAISRRSDHARSQGGQKSASVGERSTGVVHRARFKDSPYLEVWCDAAPIYPVATPSPADMHVWPRTKKAWEMRVLETPLFLTDATDEAAAAADDDDNYVVDDIPPQESSETLLVPIEDASSTDLEVKLSMPSRPQAPTPPTSWRSKSARPILTRTRAASPMPRGRPGSATSSMSSDSVGMTEDGSVLLDYDTQLHRHGWRMEVPGDPLGLKRPCLPKRLSYTTKIRPPSVAPDAPGVHMENYDTYFMNTIPRHRRTFAIHGEWPSELLHQKRMEHQNRGARSFPFRCHNFSFLY